ncbi:hypothetical protein Ancab_033954 [Ancistrocladus abbreviatus]
MSCKCCGSHEVVCGDMDFPVCTNCGTVQDLNNLQHHYGGISGPQGTFVRLGTAGFGTDYSYKERKLFQAGNIVDDITYKLSFTDARKEEVKRMVDKVTDGEFGIGGWFSVLVGACCYIIMRKNEKPLPITEVAAVVECDLFELGKMVSRVVEFLGLELPEFDIVGMMERTIKTFSEFSGFDKDQLDLMIKQGNFMLQCAMNWFLTTGRRPGPMVAAVLVFVSELNDIKVKIEDVATELNLVVNTCKKRHNELLEALVKVAQKLPWGKDVNVKNIMKNAQFVIQYMEMKSMANTGAKRRKIGDESGGFYLGDAVGDCLTREVDYGLDGTVGNDSQYYYGGAENENDGLRTSSTDDMENLKISPETLARLYQKFKTDASNVVFAKGSETSVSSNRHSSWSEIQLYEWWSGRSDLCKKLSLKQVWKKDVGLVALPPSYIRGCQAVKRRREKIKASKKRIHNVIHPPDNIPSEETDVCLPETVSGRRKRRKMQDKDIDWEDFIIETLLLHRVKEEEIEKGYYNTLLDSHVFNSGII